MLKRVAVATAAVVLAALAATPLAADAVDDFVEGFRVREKIPGLAVLVMRGGEIERAKGYGSANLEHDVPVTADTIFQSGSTGKMFTAAGILLLAEDGKLRLDDPLARHFLGGPASWHRITIRHLLTHTSGIKDYGEEIDFRKDYTEAELLKIMQALPIEFEPGTQWSYSNSGYLTLGLLTSKLAGKPWFDFQRERIFEPLGMKTTRVLTERDLVPHRAAGYEPGDQGEPKNQEWVSPTLNQCADGALYFSANDLAAWERALRAGKFLKAESFGAWWTPVSLGGDRHFPYGFGWSFAEQRGRKLVEHGGAWQGFRAQIARYPEEDLFVAVLGNSSSAAVEAISHAVAGLVEPKLKLRDAGVPPPDADPARTAALREVLAAWSEFRKAPAMSPTLAATASASLREAGNRRRTGSRLAAAKSFRYLGEDVLTAAASKQIGDGAERAVEFLLEGGKERLVYRFVLDGQGRALSFASEER